MTHIRSIAAVLVVGLLSAACAVLDEISEPVDSGTVAARSIPKGARAEILWDRWGVPHVFARDDASMFYAVGWAQMHNHGDLMLRLYGQARGRAAEYWGEEYAKSDEQVLQMRVPRRAGEWEQSQDPKFLALLEGYVAGVNAYAEAHPDRVADEVEQVLPVTVTDLFAHQQRAGVLPFAFELVGGTAKEWQTRGSNAWAIAPKRSASGHAMLVVNPHIPWGTIGFGGLFQVSEMQAAAPGYDYYGALQLGVPCLGGGFNDYLGYAGTVNTLDSVDIFELTLKDDGYLWNGEVKPFETESVSYKVRDKSGALEDRQVVVKWSLHGPVVAEKPGKALAVRLADYEQSRQYQTIWDMSRAKSFAEFDEYVRRLQMPKMNLIYADRDGNIFYTAMGKIPKRMTGDAKFWAGIVPGDSDKTLWTDTLAADELPRILNPESGWLQNANDPPWSVTNPHIDPAQYPFTFSDREMGLRPQRSTKMISEREKLSFDEVIADKLSTRLELADRILDDLEEAVAAHGNRAAKEAMSVLKAWDRETDADSRGAVLFLAWVEKMTVPGRGLRGVYAEPWDIRRPTETPDGLADPRKASAALSQAAKAVKKAYGSLDVPYGDVYRLRWAGGIDEPGNGASGSVGAFRVTNFVPDKDGKQRAIGGDSMVFVIEFGESAKAKALLSYGNASQPGSPHIGDQMALYSRKELRPVWRTRAEIEANLERREILN
jgi:acyl-homoserine-lactone acylase